MKATRIYAAKDIRIENIDIRPPNPDEVQINVKYCGICGSDIHGYFHGWALPTVPHPITGNVTPVVLGHEFAGEVVKVGKDVGKFSVGDRVTVEPLIYCNHCEACRKGMFSCCENAVGPDGSGNIYGFAANGGFAEYVNIDQRAVYLLPQTLDYQLGALVEPVAVAVKAVHRSGMKVGQTVAIVGAGPIGLLIAAVAIQGGASGVYMSDISEERLQKAREIGVKHTINPTKQDFVQYVKQATGNGVDVVFDVAGVQSSIDTAIDIVKKLGTIQIVAVFAKNPEVRFADILMKGVNINTTLCYENNYPETLRLINLQPEIYARVITKIAPLDKLVDVIESLSTDKSQAKVLIEIK